MNSYIFIEKIRNLEKIVQNANPTYQSHHQIPIVPIAPPKLNIAPVKYPQVTLSDEQIDTKDKQNIFDALRWLAEWCLRQIKMVQYKDIHYPDN